MERPGGLTGILPISLIYARPLLGNELEMLYGVGASSMRGRVHIFFLVCGLISLIAGWERHREHRGQEKKCGGSPGSGHGAGEVQS